MEVLVYCPSWPQSPWFSVFLLSLCVGVNGWTKPGAAGLRRALVVWDPQSQSTSEMEQIQSCSALLWRQPCFSQVKAKVLQQFPLVWVAGRSAAAPSTCAYGGKQARKETFLHTPVGTGLKHVSAQVNGRVPMGRSASFLQKEIKLL